MTATRVSRLAAVFAVAAVVMWLLGGVLYLRLPPPSWTAAVGLALPAAAEAFLARVVAMRLDGRPGTRPMRAIEAAPYVALAKASSLVGAAAAGFWTGLAVYALQQRGSVRSASDDATAAAAAAVAGLLLVVAALLLERACRADRRRPGDRGRDAGTGTSDLNGSGR
ncbi:MAG TPA: DUF3180 domain-containing protein [Mycobacteriales bacterium]|nr:DUF3180 domain-containing protein [Mycobacteriales bacterium]